MGFKATLNKWPCRPGPSRFRRFGGGPRFSLPVLIVEARDTGKFAKLLYNMIGKNDDTEDGLTGPVDGSAEASIFNEGQFAQTAISSSQKVVFIGRPDGADDYIDAIRLDNPDAIDEDGVYIGVSGNHACITVNSELPTKEGYWRFLERAKGHGMTFDDLLSGLRSDGQATESEEDEPNRLTCLDHWNQAR